jgi:hypothetical protein
MYRRAEVTGDIEIVRTVVGGTVVYEAPHA